MPCGASRLASDLAHGVEPGLAGAVGGAVRLAAERTPRRHVDDLAAAVLDHVPCGAVADIRRTDEIRPQNPAPGVLPFVIVDLFEKVVDPDAGVVDDDVESAERLDGRRHQVLDRLRVGDIRLQHDVTVAGKLREGRFGRSPHCCGS